MFKKKVIAVIMASFFYFGCSSAEKVATETKPTEKNIVNSEAEDSGIKNKGDFRNAKWGMTIQDVSKIEIKNDIFDITDINGLGLYEEILGINALVIYEFEEGKLVKGSYLASGKDITEERYNKIKEILNNKYGEYKLLEQKESMQKVMEWRNGKTIVRYLADFEYSDMKLEYFEKNYFNKQYGEEVVDMTSEKLF